MLLGTKYAVFYKPNDTQILAPTPIYHGFYIVLGRKYDIVYDNKADAERVYSTLLSSKDEDIKSIYRDGCAVIYGTAQGVNDARS